MENKPLGKGPEIKRHQDHKVLTKPTFLCGFYLNVPIGKYYSHGIILSVTDKKTKESEVE